MSDGGVRAPEGAPSFQISTGALAGSDALDVYRQVTGEIFHSRPAGDLSPDDFRIDMTAWHLGSLMVALARGSALSFDRSREIVAAGGLDHVMIQLYIEGGFDGVAGEDPILVRPGDICVFDLAGTLRTETSDFRSLTVLVPRPFFEAAMEDVHALHGVVLAGDQPLTELLAIHLLALAERLPRLGGREAEAAARATVALFASVLADCARVVGHRRSHQHPAPIVSPFRGIARYIDHHLHERGLEPDTIAEAFGLSRASLYRIFEPVGGVAESIRRRRLTRAALDLAAPERRGERISEVAFRWGFVSDGAFSRSFRAHFGVNPSDARRQADRIWTAYSGGDMSAPTKREFTVLMRTLGD